MKYRVWILAASILSGCASLSKEECNNADWFLIGFEDGSRGKALSTVGEHRKACARVNITPDFARYESGHQKGATHYCTLENGFALGEAGGAYNGVCIKTTEARFLKGYHAGKNRFDLRRMIDHAVANITKHAERMDELQAEVREVEAAIVDAGSSSTERRRHLKALRELQKEKAAMEADTKALEYELEELRHRLDELIYSQRGVFGS